MRAHGGPPLPHLQAPQSWSSTSEVDAFRALNDALQAEGVEEELCQVGGAVLRLVFQAAPGTRRPHRLFADVARAKSAEDRVGRRLELPPDWIDTAVRRHLSDGDVLFDAPRLRIYQAPSDYVLAMKCAALRFAPDSNTESDVRYLLMYLGIKGPEPAMALVDRYLSPRHRPSDLAERIAALLP